MDHNKKESAILSVVEAIEDGDEVNNAEKTAEIAGVKVAFCCGNCLSKVTKAEKLEDKAKIAFAEAAFKKGFAKAGTK